MALHSLCDSSSVWPRWHGIDSIPKYHEYESQQKELFLLVVGYVSKTEGRALQSLPSQGLIIASKIAPILNL